MHIIAIVLLQNIVLRIEFIAKIQWIQLLKIYFSVSLGKPGKRNLLLLHASYKDCGPTWYTILPQMDSFAFR